MHIPFLKNDTQLKQKKVINKKQKINHLNLLKNKNHVWKKKITSKQINQKKKKKKEYEH